MHLLCLTILLLFQGFWRFYLFIWNHIFLVFGCFCVASLVCSFVGSSLVFVLFSIFLQLQVIFILMICFSLKKIQHSKISLFCLVILIVWLCHSRRIFYYYPPNHWISIDFYQIYQWESWDFDVCLFEYHWFLLNIWLERERHTLFFVYSVVLTTSFCN